MLGQALEPVTPAPAATALGWISEPTLRAMDFPDAEYLIDGELPVGYTLLLGAPKTGKTALMLPIAQDLARSGHRVAYLVLDDSARRMQARDIAAAPDETFPSLWFCMDWNPEDATEAFVTLDEWLQSARDKGQGFDFVVVDTYGVFVGSRPKGDVFGFDYRQGQRFKALCAKHRTSIMAAHHTRKGDEGEDWIDQASGSAGMAASVDSLWLIKRTRQSREGVLRITGNDIEEVTKPVTLGDDMVWRASTTTTVAQARHTGCPRAILDYLMTNTRQTLGEIEDATGERQNTIRSALQRLQGEGLVTCERTDWSLTDHTDNSLPVPGRVIDKATGKPTEPARGTCRVCGQVMTAAGSDVHPNCAQPRVVSNEPPADVVDEGTPQEQASGIRMLQDAIAASRMKPFPCIPKAGRELGPWPLLSERMAGEHRWEAPLPPAGLGLVAVLDRNGSYPSAAGSVLIAPATLAHTGRLDERGDRAGIFLVESFPWTDERIGHPLGRIAELPGIPTDHGRAGWWVTTPHLAFLESYAAKGVVPRPRILDSWTSRATGGLFTAFSKSVQEARLAAREAGDVDAYVRVKRSSSIAIRSLWPKEAASPFWRPDWFLSIKAEAAIRHWIRAWQAVDCGAALVRLGSVDEAAFVAPADADASWVPFPYRLGKTYGCVKHKDDVLVAGVKVASPLTLQQWSERGRRARG